MYNDKFTELIVTNISHEMYNDGLYFLENSQQTNLQSNKWRYQRSAIISFVASFESYLNRIILKSLKSIESKEGYKKRVFNFLMTGGCPPGGFTSIKHKITLLEKIHGVKHSILETEYSNSFQKIVYLRNKIVHYSHGNFSEIYNSDIESKSIDTPKLLRDYLMFVCSKINEELPPFYLNEKYNEINM